MTLFDDDRLNEFKEAGFDDRSAFAGVLLAVAAADGHIADIERANLEDALSQFAMFHTDGPARVSDVLDKLAVVLKRDGVESLLKRATSALPATLRQTVFINAVDLVLADGVLDVEEEQVIATLMELLEIEEPLAKKVIRVMSYKNSG